jgi:hypothetical protein
MAARPRKADIIRDRIVNLAHDETSGWEPVPGLAGLTIRHTDEHETHPANRAKPGEGAGFGTWDQPTYHSHTFVTLVAGKVILGYSAAPWMSRNDSDIPFWLAEAILGDHTLAGDYTRINAMRDARKKGRA